MPIERAFNKHVSCSCELPYRPRRKILIERLCSAEHIDKVLYIRDVPTGYVLVELSGIREHLKHSPDLSDVPVSYRLVERRVCEHDAHILNL